MWKYKRGRRGRGRNGWKRWSSWPRWERWRRWNQPDEITKARALLDDGVVEPLLGDDVVDPPIAGKDIALAVRITIRNMDDLPRTPLSMKEQILLGPPPTYTITTMQTYGDQMAFLRVIEQLGALDRLPLPSGDGVPDLDVDAPLSYVGLSMGSVHGSGFLPYAPEIKAAEIAAGALRQGEGYFARGTFIEAFPLA